MSEALDSRTWKVSAITDLATAGKLSAGSPGTWVSPRLITWEPTPTLHFQMIHLLVSFPAKNAMSYSFWNAYRWELEPGVEDSLIIRVISNGAWLSTLQKSPSYLLYDMPLTTPTHSDLKLYFPVNSNSVVSNTCKALGIIYWYLACRDVLLRGVCVRISLLNETEVSLRAGTNIVLMFYLMSNDETKKWRYTVKKLYQIWSQIMWINCSLAMECQKNTPELWVLATSCRK